MTYDILLTKRNKKFIARVCQWPEIVVEGDTEEGALAMAQSGLRKLLFSGKIVHLDIEPEAYEHTWSKYAGMFVDDSDWEAFQESVSQYRMKTNSDEIEE
jgi:predicted RNase H-like HicB family nuclease